MSDFARVARLVHFGGNLYIRSCASPDLSKDYALGEWLCEELTSMGPLYMKLGQFFSSRQDVVPEAIAKTLSLLQDSAPAFPLDRGYLNGLMNAQFTVCDKPLAAASMASVFSGTYAGCSAVFKVQRPGLRDHFSSELGTLTNLLGVLSLTGIHSFVTVNRVFKDCVPLLNKELDFEEEAKSLVSFRKSLSDVHWITVPRVFFCAKDVIVMEYVASIKLTDVDNLRAAGLEGKDIAMKLMASFSIQILRNGFFHGDPHPGNVGVSKNGNIVFYDAGIVMDVRRLRKHFLQLTRSIAAQDVDAVIESMLLAGIVSSMRDRRALRYIVKSLLDYVKETDIKKLHSSVVGGKLSGTSNLFQLDTTFVYLMRSMSMVEGSCKLIDPDFNYKDFVDLLLPRIRLKDNHIFSTAFEMMRDAAAVPKSVKQISDALEEQNVVLEESVNNINVIVKAQSGLCAVLLILYLMSK